MGLCWAFIDWELFVPTNINSEIGLHAWHKSEFALVKPFDKTAMMMIKRIQSLQQLLWIVSAVLLPLQLLLPFAHAQFGVVSTQKPVAATQVPVATPVAAVTEAPMAAAVAAVTQAPVAAPVAAVTQAPVVAPLTDATSAPTETISSVVIDLPGDSGFGGTPDTSNATIDEPTEGGQDFEFDFAWRLYSESATNTNDGVNEVKAGLEKHLNDSFVEKIALPEGMTIDVGALNMTLRGACVCVGNCISCSTGTTHYCQHLTGCFWFRDIVSLLFRSL